MERLKRLFFGAFHSSKKIAKPNSIAGKIFVNYRRGDDPGFTQALYQRLEEHFGAANLFMDVEGHIKPGEDFVKVLNEQVAASDIVLVVIGPRWLESLAARANDANDFVLIEIRAGLDQGKAVIPVIVGGATMPGESVLPNQIRALARRNAVELRAERFKADCLSLVASLRDNLKQLAQQQVPQSRSIFGYLQPIDGGKSIEIRSTTARIGRGRDNDIDLANHTVSRRHAVLKWQSHNGRFIIADLTAGGPGVLVNKERVYSHELSDGDIIEIGEVKLRLKANSMRAWGRT